MAIQIGDKAPDFTFTRKDGSAGSLQSLLQQKKTIVLYFYPKDETPGCTAQACAFRDSYETFTEAGAEVIGVTPTRPRRTTPSPRTTGCPSCS